MRTRTHECKKLPKHFHIEENLYSGEWSVVRQPLHETQLIGFDYCPWCGERLR